MDSPRHSPHNSPTLIPLEPNSNASPKVTPSSPLRSFHLTPTHRPRTATDFHRSYDEIELPRTVDVEFVLNPPNHRFDHDDVTRTARHIPEWTPLDRTDRRMEILEMLQHHDVIPFPESYAVVFRASRRASIVVNFVLGWPGYLFIVVVPTFLTIVASQIFKVNHGIALFCVFLALVVSNMASMYFTGTAPNSWSENSDRDLEACESMQLMIFDNLALFMLDQASTAQGRAKMCAIAKNIDIPRLRQRVADATMQRIKVASVIRNFSYTIRFLSTGSVPHHAMFAHELRVRGLLPDDQDPSKREFTTITRTPAVPSAGGI